MPARPAPRRIEVRNVNHPGHVSRVLAEPYEAMEKAVLAVLQPGGPGLTHAELKAGVLPLLPEAVFPGGDKAGWWLKSVQLDLEAKGILAREATKPLRFRRPGA